MISAILMSYKSITTNHFNDCEKNCEKLYVIKINLLNM